MEEPRLDEFFRDKLEDFSPPPYDLAAWASLEPRMSLSSTGTSLAFWHWVSGVLGALLLLSWAYLLSAPSGERQIAQQLDSLQQQIRELSASQIQKDTVYIYLSKDSISTLNPHTYTENSPQSTLTQAQNPTTKRSANSSPPLNKAPSNLLSKAQKQSLREPIANTKPLSAGQKPFIAELSSSTDTVGLTSSTPSENAATDTASLEVLSDEAEIVAGTEKSLGHTEDSIRSSEEIITQTKSPGDSLLAETNPLNAPDSSASVRPQPDTKKKKEPNRILQNWISSREVRAGLQVSGGSLVANNIGSGFQSVGGLFFESNLNDNWWLGTGLDVGYRKFEGKNEDGNLPQDVLDALPGLVDPITAADLKEFYMRGYSLGIPLALRREFYLNRDWDLGLQASVTAHRYFLQDFEYESFTDEKISYQSRGSEQQWTISPLRLSVMAIHNDRFRPSIGFYTEYDLMARGVEPIRFWSVGMQASFGLQLK